MRIVSTLANVLDAEGHVRTVFDTVADGRHLITALALSPDGGEHLTQVGQQTVDLAGVHHRTHYPQAAVHLLPVGGAGAVRGRIVSALAAAAEHDMVVVLAATDAIAADVLKVLGLTAPGGGRRASH